MTLPSALLQEETTRAPSGATSAVPRIWCDLTSCGDRAQAFFSSALQGPIDGLLVRSEQLTDVHLPERLTVLVLVERDDIAAAARRSAPLVTQDPDLLPALREHGLPVGLVVDIHDETTLRDAVGPLGQVDFLVARLGHETNIPLELLVAEAEGRRAKVVKWLQSPEDALATSGVLERGPYAMLFTPQDVDDFTEMTELVLRSQEEQLELEEAVVVESRHIGMGSRACVDVAALFEADEGMLVGSTSAGGILVCAEVHYLPYMKLRPFRVNAGSVHSYVWGPHERTSYLTELEVGERSLAVSTSGRGRPVVVGRVKIEVRPLRLILCRVDDVRLNVILQDDWHVRVFDADGRSRNCTEIRPDDRLLAKRCDTGRHVGISVHETIVEQ